MPQPQHPRIPRLSRRLLVAVACALVGLAASAGSAVAYVPAADSFAPANAPVVLRSVGATVADTTPPTVTAITLASTSRTAATYSVTFSEVVTGVTSTKLTLGGTSTGWTISASVTGSGAGPYVFTLANATSGGAPAGTLIPTVVLGAGSDAAANQSVRLVGSSTSFGTPVNTVAPVVSGTLRGANTLTATSGTWPQAPTITYAHQWQVSADGSTGWASATGDGNATASYKVAAVDVGKYVRVAVTATNTYGSATAYSSSASASAFILPSLVVYTQNAGANTVSVFNRLANGQLTPISPVASATVTVAASPRQSVISPDGRFVYVTSYSGNAISQFSAGQGGELTPLAPATVTASAAYKLAIAPNGRFLYATGYGCSCIYQYAIGATGALTALTPATVASGASMQGITVSPNSGNVYAVGEADGKVYQYAVGASGALTALSPASVAAAGTSSTDVVIAPGGGYAYVASFGSNAIYQYSVAAGGQLSALSPTSITTGAATAPRALAIDSTGTTLYAGLNSSAQVLQYTIGGSGTLAAKSPAGVAAAVATLGVAITPDGTNLYAGSNSATSVHQYSIVSGALAALSPATVTAGTTTQFPSVMQSPPGELAYLTPTSTLYKTTGTYTVSFNRPIDPATISTADFVLSGTSTGWAVTSVTAVVGTNNTQFAVVITGTSPTDGSIILDVAANSFADSDGVIGPGVGPNDTKAATVQYLQNPAQNVTAGGFQGYNFVTWTMPTDTASITGWKVYWGLSGGAGLTNSVSLSGATTAEWRHNGLTLSTPYF
ncbi:MAG: beta-propeller fold lactonase family protein, partial [Thermoleophilia bacterium]